MYTYRCKGILYTCMHMCIICTHRANTGLAPVCNKHMEMRSFRADIRRGVSWNKDYLSPRPPSDKVTNKRTPNLTHKQTKLFSEQQLEKITMVSLSKDAKIGANRTAEYISVMAHFYLRRFGASITLIITWPPGLMARSFGA